MVIILSTKLSITKKLTDRSSDATLYYFSECMWPMVPHAIANELPHLFHWLWLEYIPFNKVNNDMMYSCTAIHTRVRMILALGYWVLPNIRQYCVLSDIFIGCHTQYWYCSDILMLTYSHTTGRLGLYACIFVEKSVQCFTVYWYQMRCKQDPIILLGSLLGIVLTLLLVKCNLTSTIMYTMDA